jgi:hypothetical protein
MKVKVVKAVKRKVKVVKVVKRNNLKKEVLKGYQSMTVGMMKTGSGHMCCLITL